MREHAYCLDHRSFFCRCVAAWMYRNPDKAAAWFGDLTDAVLVDRALAHDLVGQDETPANGDRDPQEVLWR